MIRDLLQRLYRGFYATAAAICRVSAVAPIETEVCVFWRMSRARGIWDLGLAAVPGSRLLLLSTLDVVFAGVVFCLQGVRVLIWRAGEMFVLC